MILNLKRTKWEIFSLMVIVLTDCSRSAYEVLYLNSSIRFPSQYFYSFHKVVNLKTKGEHGTQISNI